MDIICSYVFATPKNMQKSLRSEKKKLGKTVQIELILEIIFGIFWGVTKKNWFSTVFHIYTGGLRSSVLHPKTRVFFCRNKWWGVPVSIFPSSKSRMRGSCFIVFLLNLQWIYNIYSLGICAQQNVRSNQDKWGYKQIKWWVVEPLSHFQEIIWISHFQSSSQEGSSWENHL
jgi:hypothetical protein